MTERPHELLVSERPVRSDFDRERVYARRRIITVVALACLLGGGAYVFWGDRGPSEVPTIVAAGPYKEKPADPGGIDIPHQDVHVYDQLESKKGDAPQVEHLLPPPETPKEAPVANPPAAAKEPPPAFESIAAPSSPMPPAPAAAPATPVGVALPNAAPVPVASAPSAPAVDQAKKPEEDKVPLAAKMAPKEADILPSSSVKAINTTVSPAPVAPVKAAKTKETKETKADTKPAPIQEKTIEQLINDLAPKSPSPSPAPVAPSPLTSEPALATAPAVPVQPMAPPPPALSSKAASPSLAPSAAKPAEKAKETAKEKEEVKTASASRGTIQVASLPSEAQARAMMEKMQKKYATELRGAKLHIVRADLGQRGVYYRIQSQVLSGTEANRICSSLKRVNAGCIFVAK